MLSVIKIIIHNTSVIIELNAVNDYGCYFLLLGGGGSSSFSLSSSSLSATVFKNAGFVHTASCTCK